MTATVREIALEALKTTFSAVEAGTPVLDPYTITWQKVSRAPLGDDDWKKKYTLGIHDMDETTKAQQMSLICTLRVALEFRVVIEPDQVPSTELGIALGEIKRRLYEDNTLGGVAIDCTEESNEIEVDSDNDRRLSGVVWVNLVYRHSVRDPRVRI